MADRFSGTVSIGGKVAQEQFEKCSELLDACVNEERNDDGSWYFSECTTQDFLPLVEYCIEHGIALCLHWDAKHGEDSTLEYWVDGKYKQFLSSGDGVVAIRLTELQERTGITIAQFIDKLDIPDFPDFEIVQESAV